MLDVAILRTEPGRLAAAMERRGAADFDIESLVQLDEERRRVRAEAEDLRADQKRAGQEIARLQGDEKAAAIARVADIADRYKELLAAADRLDADFHDVWVTVPNLPHDSVPTGAGDDDNVEIKRWGEPRSFEFTVEDHQNLGEALGIIDIERAAKVSGSRFAYLKGQAVLLELSLVRWAIDALVGEGFTPVVPPVLVRDEALYGTGFFPADRDQVYAIEADDLYLAGTAEVPLAAMHLDEIFDADDLPRRYVGFSTCFRREAGTYGKDTRGIFRVHQFDKVEMFSFVTPDRSWDEHEVLFGIEERLIQDLGLPYRVVNVCTGDLGASAAKKYDIEVWLPSQEAFRELTSCSNTTDYQSRRLKVRYRADAGNELVHTLNGTAIAVGRTLLAIMENYQNADGSITVPEVLRPYAGFDAIKSTSG